MDLQDTFNEIVTQLGKPYQDLIFVLEALEEVLIENGEGEFAKTIPWVNGKHSIKGTLPNIDTCVYLIN